MIVAVAIVSFFFFFPFHLTMAHQRIVTYLPNFNVFFQKAKHFFFLNSLVVSTIFHFSLKNGKIKQILSLRFVLLLFHFHFKCWFKNPQVSEKKMKKKKASVWSFLKKEMEQNLIYWLKSFLSAVFVLLFQLLFCPLCMWSASLNFSKLKKKCQSQLLLCFFHSNSKSKSNLLWRNFRL